MPSENPILAGDALNPDKQQSPANQPISPYGQQTEMAALQAAVQMPPGGAQGPSFGPPTSSGAPPAPSPESRGGLPPEIMGPSLMPDVPLTTRLQPLDAPPGTNPAMPMTESQRYIMQVTALLESPAISSQTKQVLQTILNSILTLEE